MKKKNVISLEDRVPKIKKARKRRANRTLAFLVILFLLLVGLIVYFQSPLSHVGDITVRGNDYYSPEHIVAQSGLTNETNIWQMKKKQIIHELEALQQIKSAQLVVQAPNKVVIEIVEYERLAYVMEGNYFCPVLENGEIFSEDKTKVLANNGLVLFDFTEEEERLKMLGEIKKLPEEVVNAISEAYYRPTEMDAYAIVLYMNDGFEVHATLRSFSEKMVHYPAISSQLDPEKKGLIDLEVGSFFKEYDILQEKDEDAIVEEKE